MLKDEFYQKAGDLKMEGFFISFKNPETQIDAENCWGFEEFLVEITFPFLLQ